MRQLSLHVSALNDVEYDIFTASLSDLVLTNDSDGSQSTTHDDAYYERVSVGVREARAWLRGRYPHVPPADIDSILKLFHPNLRQSDSLSGGQFFAVLRLVVHIESGKVVDKALAFVQSYPNPHNVSRPSSPRKRELPPTPLHQTITQQRPTLGSSNSQSHPIQDAPSSTLSNPFHYTVFTSDNSHQSNQVQRTLPPVPTLQPLNQSQHQTEHSHNPFLPHTNPNNPNASPSWADDTRTTSKLPPLPPRKPPPPIPTQSQTALMPPPRHGSLPMPLAKAASSPLAFSPSSPPLASASPTPKTAPSSHVTSTLMKQSLQASKVAQTMKKAEEGLEKERVLQVLKSSAVPAPSSASAGGGAGMAPRNRSTSPTKWVYLPPSSVATSSTAYTSGSDERAPPLPRRRTHNSQPSNSISSLEQIALAGASRSSDHSLTSKPPTATTQPSFNTFGRANVNPTTNSSVTSPPQSPPKGPVDLPAYTGPPPVHPGRKPPLSPHPHSHPSKPHLQAHSTSPSDADSFEMIYGSDAASEPNYTNVDANSDSPRSRVFRSKSLHHHSPPPVPPPLRRRRPESVQVFGTGLGEDDSPGNAGDGIWDNGNARSSVSRRVSLSTSSPGHMHKASSTLSQSNANASSTAHHDSPLGNIQRTLATLQPKLDSLQPRLEKARYKAEAGLSRRGFVRDGRAGKSGLEGEEEEGLMEWRGRDDVTGRVLSNDSAEIDEEISDKESGSWRHVRHTSDGDHDGVGGVEKDNLKWPTGEGWKPL